MLPPERAAASPAGMHSPSAQARSFGHFSTVLPSVPTTLRRSGVHFMVEGFELEPPIGRSVRPAPSSSANRSTANRGFAAGPARVKTRDTAVGAAARDRNQRHSGERTAVIAGLQHAEQSSSHADYWPLGVQKPVGVSQVRPVGQVLPKPQSKRQSFCWQ
jgi:hypothetical protein